MLREFGFFVVYYTTLNDLLDNGTNGNLTVL